MARDKSIKCSVCKVTAKAVVPKGKTKPDRVICPRCGTSEDYGVVIRSFGKQMEAFAAKELQKIMKGQPAIRKGGGLSLETRFETAKVKKVKTKFFIDFDN